MFLLLGPPGPRPSIKRADPACLQWQPTYRIINICHTLYNRIYNITLVPNIKLSIKYSVFRRKDTQNRALIKTK